MRNMYGSHQKPSLSLGGLALFIFSLWAILLQLTAQTSSIEVVDNLISRMNYELYNYDYRLKLLWKCMFSFEPQLAVAEQEFEQQQDG